MSRGFHSRWWQGTAMERAAQNTDVLCVPFFWYETDTGDRYCWDGSAWALGELPAVAGAGYALVSTGVNTWGADQTPTWTGRHTFDAGLLIPTPHNSKGNAFATVQEAIDDLEAGPTPGWVFVPAGTWDERLVLTQTHITVFGTGWGSIINETADSGHAITISGNYCSVRDLQCRTEPAGGNAYTGVYITAAFTRLENVYANGSDHRGIQCTGDCSIIENCLISESDGYGMYIVADEVHITNCRVQLSSDFGVVLQGLDGVVMVGNIIDTTANDGIFIQTDAENCVIVGNRIKGWTNEAIDDDSGTSTVASNDTAV